MTEQPQIIRVDPARVDDIRSYASDHGLSVIFRRLIIAPDNEQGGNQMVPSAAVALSWAMAIGMRDMLDAEIKRHEAAHGPVQGTKVSEGARMN